MRAETTTTTPPAAPAVHQLSPSEVIRAARMRLGISQMQLAARAGLHLATVSNGERGLMTDATRAKLAAVLGVDPQELVR